MAFLGEALRRGRNRGTQGKMKNKLIAGLSVLAAIVASSLLTTGEHPFFRATAVATVTGAFGVILLPNIVRAALCLMLTFFGVAIFYVMLGADLLAAFQVLVYIGGILVMILFAVMFTQRRGEQSYLNPSKGPLTLIGSAALCGGLYFILRRIIATTSFPVRPERPIGSTVQAIGDHIVTSHVIPFEVIAVLLLMTLVGTVVLIKKEINAEEDALS